MILVSGVSLPFSQDEEQAVHKGRAEARLTSAQVVDGFVYKRSLDARKRQDIRYVYTLGFVTNIQESRYVTRLNNPRVTQHEEHELKPSHGEQPLAAPPVIAGFGPAGMFCALLLAREGYRPVVLERGGDVERRVAAVERFWRTGELDEDCNVQFGEGGAGTFSDGKLTTRINDPLCEWVTKRLVECGAPGGLLRQHKPHIGTDRLRGVVKRLREEILSLGGQVHFDTRLLGLVLQSGRVVGASTSKGGLPAGVLIAALGHSARDSFSMLHQSGAKMSAKSFSVGVRIEHLQSEIEKGLYGGFAGHPRLPKGEYQLSWRQGERGVYTFCMCPGGLVVPAASQKGGVVVNGMSEFARDAKNANSALCCSVTPQDFGTHPLDGVRFQERLERQAFLLGGSDYRAPVQTVGRFLEGRAGADFLGVTPSYALGVTPANFEQLLPDFACEPLRKGLGLFGARLSGFGAPDAVLTGIESRTSSPVRIERGENFQSSIPGLYPCGEGAGYAGGIMSAAVDGLRTALAVINAYAPPGR